MGCCLSSWEFGRSLVFTTLKPALSLGNTLTSWKTQSSSRAELLKSRQPNELFKTQGCLNQLFPQPGKILISLLSSFSPFLTTFSSRQGVRVVRWSSLMSFISRSMKGDTTPISMCKDETYQKMGQCSRKYPVWLLVSTTWSSYMLCAETRTWGTVRWDHSWDIKHVGDNTHQLLQAGVIKGERARCHQYLFLQSMWGRKGFSRPTPTWHSKITGITTSWRIQGRYVSDRY